MKAKHSGAAGLLVILLVAGLLYYSGAGTLVVARLQGLGGGCYAMMNRVGFTGGGRVCDGVARGVDMAVEAGATVVAGVREMLHGTGTRMEGAAQEVFARLHVDAELADLTSPAKKLQAMMGDVPYLADASASAKERLQLSLDQFVIGQQYLQQAAPEKAAPWFQQSARQPGGYGVLSQMTLGDMYSAGNGVDQNPAAARYYYTQAQHSLATLQGDPSSSAQTLLHNLPMDSAALTQQLQQRIQSLR